MKFFENVKILLCVTLVVRIAFCLWIFPQYCLKWGTVGEQYLFDNYYEISRSLLHGSGFLLQDGTTVFHRLPLYPLTLTIPLGIANLLHVIAISSQVIFIQIFNVLLALGGVYFSYKIGQLFLYNRHILLLTSYCIALWPFSIWINRLTIPENLLYFLVPCSLYYVLKRYYCAGVVLGGLCLTHATYLVYAMSVLAILLFSCKRFFLITLLGMCLVITPWLIRNSSYGYNSLATGFGQHYFIGWYYYKQLPFNYWQSSNFNEAHLYSRQYAQQYGEAAIVSNQDRSNIQLNQAYDKLAIKHIKSHFFENVFKTMVKMPLFWIQEQTICKSLVNILLVFPFAGLALICFFRRNVALLSVPVVFLSLSFAFVCVECAPMRYALPLMPCLIIMAGIGLENCMGVKVLCKKK